MKQKTIIFLLLLAFQALYVQSAPLKKETLKDTWENLSHHGDYNSGVLFSITELGYDYIPNTLGRYYDENQKAIVQQTNQVSPVFDLSSGGDSYALEGLVWARKPMYIEPSFGNFQYGPNRDNPNSRIGDEEGWANDGMLDCQQNRIHLWDSPQEALSDPAGAALELVSFDDYGIDLKQYIGIHCLRQSANGYQTVTLRSGDEAALGLHYEFEFVDYAFAGSPTHDSRYAAFSDWDGSWDGWCDHASTTGVVIAKSVDTAGHTVDMHSATSADREPLVRVMVKDAAGNVWLDGYVLFHITYVQKNVNVTSFSERSVNFDYRQTVSMNTTWNEFSMYVLQNALGNMPLPRFDECYGADCLLESPEVDTDMGHGFMLNIYNFGDLFGNGTDGGVAMPPTYGCGFEETHIPGLQEKGLGTAVYYPNGDYNHIISWELSKEECAFLLRGFDEVTVTRWGRFNAKDYMAPYPYVWVKLTIRIHKIPVTAGDADGDGEVSTEDVQCIADYILDNLSDVYVNESADLDDNYVVDINDIILMIRQLLVTTAPQRAGSLRATATDNYLHLADLAIMPGEIVEVPLLLTNANNVAGVQGNIKLPAGLSFVTDGDGQPVVKNAESRSNDFTLSCHLQDDGSLSFLQYSMTGKDYMVSDGGIFTLKVQASANAEPGNYMVTLADGVLSVDGVSCEVPVHTSNITVNNDSSGIPSLTIRRSVDVYTLSGQMIRSQWNSKEQLPKGIYIINGRKVVITLQ